MKILISSDGKHAHYFQRVAWASAFSACGYEVMLWDCKNVPAFDAFDKFEPDIFLGQSYNLNKSTIKCIYERPHLKVGLRSGDWGDHEDSVDKTKYNILFCSEAEKQLLKKLKEETGKPDFVHIHYKDQDVKNTHNHFATIGVDAHSIMMCADTFAYSNAKPKDRLKCDIGFVGGYWPYKGLVISEYLFPLLSNVGEFNVKIFGNQVWPVNQYCGLISDEDTKNLFVSASVCPNLSEPHAQKFGIDVNERIFKVLYSGGFCVSDQVKAYDIFGDGVVTCASPEEFVDSIKYYLGNEEERIRISKIGRNIVKNNHTGFHRISSIMKNFNMPAEAAKIMKTYKEKFNV